MTLPRTAWMVHPSGVPFPAPGEWADPPPGCSDYRYSADPAVHRAVAKAHLPASTPRHWHLALARYLTGRKRALSAYLAEAVERRPDLLYPLTLAARTRPWLAGTDRFCLPAIWRERMDARYVTVPNAARWPEGARRGRYPHEAVLNGRRVRRPLYDTGVVAYHWPAGLPARLFRDDRGVLAFPADVVRHARRRLPGHTLARTTVGGVPTALFCCPLSGYAHGYAVALPEAGGWSAAVALEVCRVQPGTLAPAAAARVRDHRLASRRGQL